MDKLLDVPALEGLNRPQGMLCSHIFVDEQTLGDDIALVQAVVDFVNSVHERAQLVPDEYPAEAIWSYHADYYLAQVNNGGHGQFAHNSGMKPRPLRDCRLGLHAMSAKENLAIFEAFLTIMAAEDERAQAIFEGGGFGEIDPEIADLDRQYFTLGDTITHLNAAWLRGLPCLRALSASDLTAALENLAESNPMRNARAAAGTEARRRFEHEDPTYSAAHACAAQEGATFKHLTAGMPLGGDNIEWGAVSSAGFRSLRIISGSHAEWRDEKRALKALYFYDTKARYPTGIGDGRVRASILGRKTISSSSDLSAQYQFFLMPLANLTLVATSQGDSKAVTALIAALKHAKSMQCLPRAACNVFAFGREHAQLRLLIAYLLWDMSIRQIKRANPSSLGDDYMRAAMMAAAGAISAAGAAAVRLPRANQIDALSRESEPDFKREQLNVWLQLHETHEWWVTQLGRIARAASERRTSDRLFFRPSSFQLAAKLTFDESVATPGVDLAQRLAYFDDEYGCDRQLATRIDRAIRTTLTMLRIESENSSLNAAARVFEAIENDPRSGLRLEPAYYLAEPKQMNSVSKSSLIGVLTVIDPAKLDGGGAIGVDFDRQGYRKMVEK